MTHNESPSGGSPQPPALTRELGRRTVLTGSAWAVPAVALTALASSAAASGTLRVAFNASSYSGTACATTNGAYITVTQGSVAQAGVAVTTSLSAGYTFSGGSQSYTGTSGSDGKVALPGIVAPGVGGTGTLVATSGAATASAQVTSPPTGQALIYSAANPRYVTGIPAGATPLNAQYFLAQGTLFYSTGTVVAGDVAATSTGWIDASGNEQIAYTTSSGGVFISSNGRPTAVSTVPSGATPLNCGHFLSRGTLFYVDGSVLSTDVAATSTGWLEYNGTNNICFTTSDGRAWLSRSGAVRQIAMATQVGGTPLNGGYVLNQGTLSFGYSTVREAAAVTSTGWQDTSGRFCVAFVSPSGQAFTAINGVSVSAGGVPDGSTPLDNGFFRNGRNLYSGGTSVDYRASKTSTGWADRGGNANIAYVIANC